MDAENHQRIREYFIAEAKEHLETIEKGLLNLRSVMQDPEQVNEMFRAAHSVKGGAAMLGFSSIQKTAHRLEDAFKILQEGNIKIDQQLETLFLEGYDTLKDLVEKLQGPFGLREEEAQQTLAAAEPSFTRLQNYLKKLVSGAHESPTVSSPPVAQTKTATTAAAAATSVPPNFASVVMESLKQMLQLFKQPETPENRQKLQSLVKNLAKAAPTIKPWQAMLSVCFKAIANSQNAFGVLAPLVIKELKLASDQLQANSATAVAASPALQKMAGLSTATAAVTQKQTAPTTATANEPAASSKVQEKPTTTPKQITVPVEPRAAAKALIQGFDRPQLLQLVKLLAQATRSS